MLKDSYDIAVVGAGVFGAWSAYWLKRSGASVVLLDAYGAGNSRASSGGESRIIRMSYGPDDLYTLSAMRSLGLWQELFNDSLSSHHLLHRTGFLLLARENDGYSEATATTLERCHVRFHALKRDELEARYPQFDFGLTTWAVFEPESGVLMARQAVQKVVSAAKNLGVDVINEPVLAPQKDGKLEWLHTAGNRKVRAKTFVFSCGPWLPKIFPELLGELIHVTRQEVFFFGVPAGGPRYSPPEMPAWVDFNDLVYAIPDVDGRGFKIAIDKHGPAFDPDTGERLASIEGVLAIRDYLSRRLPGLRDAPIVESRICQYENTANGDFLIDVHPDMPNVWLVGGGSGHGFKHGPAVGQYVSGRIVSNTPVEPRFSLATKTKMRQRTVF
jgi:monomeric sarcosine oxidase